MSQWQYSAQIHKGRFKNFCSLSKISSADSKLWAEMSSQVQKETEHGKDCFIADS